MQEAVRDGTGAETKRGKPMSYSNYEEYRVVPVQGIGLCGVISAPLSPAHARYWERGSVSAEEMHWEHTDGTSDLRYRSGDQC